MNTYQINIKYILYFTMLVFMIELNVVVIMRLHWAYLAGTYTGLKIQVRDDFLIFHSVKVPDVRISNCYAYFFLS